MPDCRPMPFRLAIVEFIKGQLLMTTDARDSTLFIHLDISYGSYKVVLAAGESEGV